ncbi:hypothetical protein [Sulfitobacter faviae]|uniref:hypothetical protein n=1 Tax=Sulfitobacter faviae TaxID=1775881 RepID=UPI002454BBBB|nr:hypothetical protein [Sulfitobacter faviae]MDH4539887.1 hypothetical protein [Sulfitobacter faviae]
MYRKFIATIAALSVAITAFDARPAAADEKEVLRTLAAIAGVAIVGKMIYDNNKERKERETVTRRRAAPVYEAPRYYPTVSKRPHPRPYVDPRPRRAAAATGPALSATVPLTLSATVPLTLSAKCAPCLSAWTASSCRSSVFAAMRAMRARS